MFLGQSGKTIEARCREHKRHSRDQPETAVVTEFRVKRGHCINFSGTSLLDRTSVYNDCLVKQEIEIWLNTNNFNRDNGFLLSQDFFSCPQYMNQEA